MLWLTGHWEWHALASYVLVPLDGEPTMIYSMGGTHAEAVRRQVEIAVKDVRHSRSGRYADVMVERLRELKLERGRIGLMEIDPRHGDYLPVNQYNVLRDNLPDAELVFTQGFLARAAFDPQRRRARLRAQSRRAVPETRWRPWSRARARA